MKINRTLLASSIAAIIAPVCALSTHTAAAQAGTLEEVVVTTERREESAQEVPIATTTFDSDYIGAYVNDVEDVSNLTPNFQITGISDPGGLSKNQNTMRGLGVTNGGNVVINTTSILTYYDGIPSGTPFASAIPTWDLERIEIARGPQGTLFGRNSLAGLIQNVSAKPTDELEGFGKYTVGEFDLRRFEGAVGGSVTDNVRTRFSALSYNRGGDITNAFYDIEQGEQDYWGIRGIVDWDVTDKMDMRVKYQKFEGDVDSIFYQGAPSERYDANTRAFIDTLGIDPDLDRNSNFTKIQSGLRDPYEKYETEMVEIDINYDFEAAQLAIVLGNLEGTTERLFDTGSYPIPWMTILERAGLDQQSAEIRLTSQGDGPFQWITGAYYQTTDDYGVTDGFDQSAQNRDADGDGLTRYNADSPEDLLDGLFVGLDGEGMSTGHVASNTWTDSGAFQELKSKAVFLHTSFDWTDRFTTTQAIRWNEEEKLNDIQLQATFEGPVSEGVVPGTLQQFDDFMRFSALNHAEKRQTALSFIDPNQVDAEGNVIFSRVENTWDELTWRFAADFQATDDKLVYASITKGFKGGQFANFRVIPGFDTAVDPTESIVTELGAKTRWLDDRLQANVSIFHNKVDNFQASVRQISPEGVVNTLGNVPEAEIVGAELEVQALLIDNLFISANLGFIDSEITKVNEQNPDLLGNELPLAEDTNFSGLIRYDMDTSVGVISPQFSWRYRGEFWSDHNNYDTTGKLGDFWTMDLRLGYESNDNGLYGMLIWENITDEVQVVRNEVPNADTLGQTMSAINKRENWRIDIGYRF